MRECVSGVRECVQWHELPNLTVSNDPLHENGQTTFGSVWTYDTKCRIYLELKFRRSGRATINTLVAAVQNFMFVTWLISMLALGLQ
jgi:hypothetical protein